VRDRERLVRRERRRASGPPLWSGDEAALAALATEIGEAGDAETRDAIAAGTALRERRGHYLGAMFYLAPEWYWGVDRLHHLERRLALEGAAHGGTPTAFLVARPQPARALCTAAHPEITLEYFSVAAQPLYLGSPPSACTRSRATPA
jgi:hypothetical protein